MYMHVYTCAYIYTQIYQFKVEIKIEDLEIDYSKHTHFSDTIWRYT